MSQSPVTFYFKISVLNHQKEREVTWTFEKPKGMHGQENTLDYAPMEQKVTESATLDHPIGMV
ncbi:hypothetical protein BOTCAL_0391g00070 [Botryotinia calthae]|uniref:Uncharacterized protein n=1 Tax=Botryotinia calthae TaxID=38488 RepID=A0A4Y8CQW2_9HELO|nr:hypothetical protein BOTCAL_0391g00070 [Botryotinia calthae]